MEVVFEDGKSKIFTYVDSDIECAYYAAEF